MKNKTTIPLRLLFLVIFSIIIYSCDTTSNQKSNKEQNTHKQKNTVKEEAKSYTLAGQEIFKDKFNVSNVYVIDSIVLIKNILAGSTKAFSIYSNKNGNFKHLLDFGIIGAGPNEFESQVYYTHQFELEGELKIWLYENNRDKYSLVNLTKTLQAKKTVVEKSIKIKPGSSYFDLYYINNQTIVGNMDNLAIKMAGLNFYNPVTDEFYKKVEFNSKLTNPKQNDLDYTQKVYNGVYANILRYHPQKSKLVSAMSSVDRINIFNTDGSTDYTINNDERQMKDVLYDANSNNNKFYNIDLTLTDNYIYALYAGVSKTNYYEANYTTKIKIYDWDYNLKYVIDVNEVLNFISVDETNEFLIGTSYTEEKVVKYSLKDILN